MILKNSNGHDYDVIKLEQFNETDADYYKNEWQKFRFGLLKNDFQVVVASMVGDTSWGNGRYYDLADIDKAEECYNDLVSEYRRLG